eukprot:SAG11_NODE_1853_length_4166_cov_1.872142_1_plen_371_part_00
MRDHAATSFLQVAEDVLKLADFGSCRGIYSKQPYTEYISTRWYRAPECLLTDGYYNYKMDIWGVGSVFFEIVSLFPLFPGTNELDQINKVHNILGTPSQELLEKFKRHSASIDFNFPKAEGRGIAKLIPHASPEAVELMTKLIAYNPDDRVSARQALRHNYFRELRQAEKKTAAQAHALALASQNSSAAATPRAAGGGGGGGGDSDSDAGKSARSTHAEDHEPGGAGGGPSVKLSSTSASAASKAAATAADSKGVVGLMNKETAAAVPAPAPKLGGGGGANIGSVGSKAGAKGLPQIHKDILRADDSKDAESISSLPPIKASLSKTWSNSSWKSWKSASSKAQKWNYQNFKSNVQPGGGGPYGGTNTKKR